MYILYPACCICLKKNNDLMLLHTLQEKHLKCYLRISSEEAEQAEEDVTKFCQICEECVASLDSVCEFIDVCQRGRVALRTYISPLQSENTVNDGSTAEFIQTNVDPFSAVYIKTEPPSEDLYSELDYKPASEGCLTTEHERVISEDIKQNIIKTELETETQENDPLSLHQQTSYVLQNCKEIQGQTDLLADSNSKESYEKIQTNKRKNSYDCGTSKSLIEKTYECNICNKQFNKFSNLTKHTRTHTGEKPYECKMCDKKFTSSSDLTRHARTHTGEKPYECKICGKKFNNVSNLARHSRTHSGEKPYECKVCEKKFIESSDLNRHLRTHTGEKPYECKVCEKKFVTSSDLTRHSVTHTGERPYECKICKKGFTTSNSVKVHSKTHIGE